jgi:hypothetical protein
LALLVLVLVLVLCLVISGMNPKAVVTGASTAADKRQALFALGFDGDAFLSAHCVPVTCLVEGATAGGANEVANALRAYAFARCAFWLGAEAEDTHVDDLFG